MVENRTWFSLLFSGRLGHPDLPHFWTTPFSRCSGCPSPDSKPSPSRTNCRDVSQRWFRKTHAEKWEPAAPETSYRYYGTTRWLKVESNFMTNAFSRSWWTQKKNKPFYQGSDLMFIIRRYENISEARDRGKRFRKTPTIQVQVQVKFVLKASSSRHRMWDQKKEQLRAMSPWAL